ncbi:MAG: 30S ribosomal protein S19 [Chlamydiia bacterium]|nr:30S ribosomal protein S19 [Chlamydiia bacterium]
MPRSLKKGPYVDEKLLKKVNDPSIGTEKKPIKTWSRKSMITPDMIGKYFSVHNGKTFNLVYVVENMVGCKLGEFSLTRKATKHPTKK